MCCAFRAAVVVERIPATMWPPLSERCGADFAEPPLRYLTRARSENRNGFAANIESVY